MKRFKYGQVDVKLGIVLGVSAEAGVLYGAGIQEKDQGGLRRRGLQPLCERCFVVILATVGGFVLLDAWKTYKSGNANTEEKAGKLAAGSSLSTSREPWSISRASIARVSVLFTIPLGFATGMMAATIAVGGFVGVPAMIYVLGAPSLMASATELVIAFVMASAVRSSMRCTAWSISGSP